MRIIIILILIYKRSTNLGSSSYQEKGRKMAKREIISIIGGSMAGLFAAISLRAQGFIVNLYERSSSSLESRGAGIATHGELKNIAKFIGKEFAGESGIISTERQLLNLSGAATHKREIKQTMSSWGLIYRFLRKFIREEEYHPNHKFLDVQKKNSKTLVIRFENGKELETNWLIGADGMNSTVRGCVDPISKPTYANYLAWRGLVKESDIEPEVLDALSNKMTFGIAPKGHWLGYLVAGPKDSLSVGNRYYNWIWYRGESQASLVKHLIGSDKKYYPNGIPHDLIKPAIIGKMHDDARASLAPQLNHLIQKTPNPFLQGIYDFKSSRMTFGRVVLIGDAAFTARPHVGLGVYKAAEDAITLAQAMGCSGPGQMESLKYWEKQRVRFGNAAFSWGQDLGSYISSDMDELSQSNRAKFFKRPEVLITQNASNNPEKYLINYYE